MNALAQMLQNPQVMQRIMQMMQQRQGQMRQPAQPMMGQRMPYNPQPVNLAATGGYNTPGFIGGAQNQAQQNWMKQMSGLQAGRDAQTAAAAKPAPQNSGVMGDPNMWANLYGG